MPNKIAIVTSVCGNLERLSNPSVVFQNADYFAFVDNKVEGLVWNQKQPIHFSNDKRFAMRRDAKVYKVLPELFIPGYEYYIWVDASIDVVSDPVSICETYLKDCDYAAFRHRERSCVYDEADLLKRINYDYPELIQNEMDYFQNVLGYPRNNGLYELPSFIKRSNETSMKVSIKWWEYICKYSSRDQISFPVCLWESNARLNVLPGHINGHHKNGLMQEMRSHNPSAAG
jgi:hypothetical protein